MRHPRKSSTYFQAILLCVLSGLLATEAHAILPGWVCRAASTGAQELYSKIAAETEMERAKSKELLTEVFLDSDYSAAGVATTYLKKHFDEYHFLKLNSTQLQGLLKAMDRVAVNPEKSEFIWTESRRYILTGAILMALTLEADVGNPNVAAAVRVGRELILAFTAFGLGREGVTEFKNWLSEARFFGRARSPGFLRRYRLNQFPPDRLPRSASDFFWSELIFPLEDPASGIAMTQAGSFYAIQLYQTEDEPKSFLIAVPRAREK